MNRLATLGAIVLATGLVGSLAAKDTSVVDRSRNDLGWQIRSEDNLNITCQFKPWRWNKPGNNTLGDYRVCIEKRHEDGYSDHTCYIADNIDGMRMLKVIKLDEKTRKKTEIPAVYRIEGLREVLDNEQEMAPYIKDFMMQLNKFPQYCGMKR